MLRPVMNLPQYSCASQTGGQGEMCGDGVLSAAAGMADQNLMFSPARPDRAVDP